MMSVLYLQFPKSGDTYLRNQGPRVSCRILIPLFLAIVLRGSPSIAAFQVLPQIGRIINGLPDAYVEDV